MAAPPAGAATLVHGYEFDGTVVTDGTGTLNGTLLGGATVSGGALRLVGASVRATVRA